MQALVGTLMGLALGFSFANLPPIAGTMADSYGVSLAVVGLMTTAFAAMHGGSQLPAGRLVDRFGPARVARAGLALLLVANCAALLMPSPALALTLRALMGIGTGLAFIAGTQYVRLDSHVGQGLFGGAVLAGQGLAVVLMPTLVLTYAWQSPCLAAGLGSAFALAALLTSKARVPIPAHRSERGPTVAIAELVRDRRLYRLAVVHSAGMSLAIVVGVWSVVLLGRRADIAPQVAGIIGSLTLVLGIVTRPLGGLLMRLGPVVVHWMLVGGLLTCAVGMSLMVWGGSVPMITLGSGMIGIGGGVTYAPIITAAARRWPGSPGTAVGFVNMVAIGVVVTGTPLVGLAFDAGSDGVAPMLVIAVLWLLAAMVVPSAADFAAPPAPVEQPPSGPPGGAALIESSETMGAGTIARPRVSRGR